MNAVASHDPETAAVAGRPVVSARGLRKAYRKKVAVTGAAFPMTKAQASV